MRVIIAKDYKELSQKASSILASQLILKPESVLGLATGSTPIGTYEELIKLNREGIVSFSSATTFNLDEYYGLDGNNPNSYNYFMRDKLFNHIDIDNNRVHIPNGLTKDIQKECQTYEKKIVEKGGIDIQLLGIGRNGHIGFNEPDAKFEAKTHLVNLDKDTVGANSRFFRDIREVPKKAISMGIKTIMNSKKILLLASGEDKASTVYNALHGEITPKVPASVLQLHQDVIVIVDKQAAKYL
ncbi:Glucosamine-6-phosphate deaminase 1 [bioreactor metagenome]|uniref:glucosamine-6-phosphate deaminase n=1 Tax=bioreactor metagenome TaxID=1076179 RepID=A0A645A510_9ZZZZ